jgi:hypothetical protein
MNKKFPPNTDPNLFSLYAVMVGYAIVNDFTMDEQNSIGNWIILVGQYLLTVSAQQQLIEARIDNKNININSREAKTTGNIYEGGKSNQNTREEVEYLLKAIKKMESELEQIKKDLDDKS